MKPNNNFEYRKHGTEHKTDTSGADSKLNLLDLRILLHFRSDPSTTAKLLMFIVGVVLTPASLIGLCWGYKRAYSRFWKPYDILPRLTALPPVFKVAMALGVVAVWLIAIVLFVAISIIAPDYSDMQLMIVYLIVNASFSAAVFVVFRRWLAGMNNLIMQTGEHGTARWGEHHELEEYVTSNGLYLGGPFTLPGLSHLLLVAGSRGGKAAVLLVNAILGVGGYKGSMVIVDPKGELSAVTASALKKQGKRVVILNPWNLLGHILSASTSYNPLNLLSDTSSSHLPDDIDLLAEMIVPKKHDDKNVFFTSSARAIVSNLLLYLVCKSEKGKATLKELWEICRYYGEEWDKVIADMVTSDHPVHGLTLKNAGREILKQMETGETFSSIMANVLEATNFLKSEPLQKSLEQGFNPYTLADGNTVVFIVIPVDKLSSHSSWLRLVTTSMLRSVVRKPGEKVTFIYDEAGNIGNVSEIPTALAAYAGFNISMWLVYQDLNQIKGAYGDKWETVVANCSVRQFMSIRDNFTQKYVSEALGKATTTLYKRDFMGNVVEVKTTARALATPDEVRTISKDNIILLAGEYAPVQVPKVPYYKNPKLKDVKGNNLYDPNPYIANSQ